MKKLLTFLTFFLLATAMAQMQAAETVFYTLNTVQSSGNTAYATNYDVTIDGMKWNAPGNQNFDGYWRIGGKSLNNVDRVITAKSPMGSAISRIYLYHNGVSNSSLIVNSITVNVYSDANLSTIIDTWNVNEPTVSVSKSAKVEISPIKVTTWPSNAYYEFVFNFTNSNTSKNYGLDLTKIEFINASTPPSPEKELTSIAVTGTAEDLWTGDDFSHEGITVTANYSDGTNANVTSDCTYSGYNMATAGNQTVTVTYGEKTATYNVTVNTIANTQETAYTATEAKALIDAGKGLKTPVYVKGTVSEIVTAFNSQYGNITFNIEDGFQFYRNQKTANDKYTEDPNISVGDDVVGFGTLTKHEASSTYEFAAGNYLVKHVKVATLSIADITVANGDDITPVVNTNVTGEYLIEYKSNNEEVVLAEGAELVTMGVGEATITATLIADGYKDAETTFKVTVTSNVSVTGVTLGGTPKLVYTYGEAFDRTGITATAKYSDNSQADVTSSATWTVAPSTALTESGEVTVTAAFGGMSASQTYNVTVNKKASSIEIDDITVQATKTATISATTTPDDAELTYTITEGADKISIADGVITGVAEGTATVKAAFAGTAEYAAAEKTFTVTVTAAPTPTTSATIVWADNGSDASSAASNASLLTDKPVYTIEGAEYVSSYSEITRVYKGKTGLKFGSGSATGSFTINLKESMDLASITLNAMQYGTTGEGTFKVTINGTDYTIGNLTADLADYTIELDGSAVSSITIATTSKRAYLKAVTLDTEAPEPVVRTLDHITISDYKTEFKQGDAFEFGGKVMASYKETEVADCDVTAQATFSGYNMNVAGEQTVTVSYTEGEITKTDTYEITVVEVPMYNVTIIAPENGTLTVKNGETVITSGTKLPEGTTLTLEFDANSGYKLRYWQDVNTATHTHTPGTSKYTKTYTMTAHSVVLKAFFDAIPAYTYTWYVNGEEYTTTPATEGAPADPATPSSLGSKVFMGWVSTPINGVTDVEPQFVTDFSNATSNKAFYAVFATKEQGEGGDDVFVCIDNNKDFASNYSATDKSWQNGWLGNEYLIAYEVPMSNTAKVFNGNASVSGSSNACSVTADITYQNGVKIIATPPTGAAIITMTPRTKTGGGTTLMLKVNDNNDEDNNEDLVINGNDSKNNLFVGTIVSMGNDIYPNTQITYNETGKYWSVVVGNCNLNYVNSASNFQCLKPGSGLTGSPISLYVKKQGTQTTYSAFTTGDAVVAGEGEFILVQSDADLVDGREYIIVAKHASGIYGLNVDDADSRTDTEYDEDGNEIPVTTGKTSPYHRRAEKGVTLSGGDLFASIDNRISVLTLAKTDGDNPTYKFNSAAGYLCLPADDSYLTVNTTLAQEETAPNYGIEVVNSIVVDPNSHISQIKFQKYGDYTTDKGNPAVRYIGYNNNNGYPRISNYSPNTTEWKYSTNIYLYYREADPTKVETLAEIEANGINGTDYTIADDLEVVFVQDGRIWAKDNADSYAKRENTYGVEDYLFESESYSQNNWIEIVFPGTASPDDIPAAGSILSGVKGTYLGYKDRYHVMNIIKHDGKFFDNVGKADVYTLNTYTMASLWDDNIYDYAVAESGKKFFLMNPKMEEYCTISDAVWNGTCFTVPAPEEITTDEGKKFTVNGANFKGIANVDWSLNDGTPTDITDIIDKTKRYKFTAIVTKGLPAATSQSAPAKVASLTGMNNASFTIRPIDFKVTDSVITAVDDVKGAKTVKGVRYYNVAGVEFGEAQPGLNIIVTEYSDGSHSAVKVIR